MLQYTHLILSLDSIISKSSLDMNEVADLDIESGNVQTREELPCKNYEGARRTV